MTIKEITNLLDCKARICNENEVIDNLITDSRKPNITTHSLFIAIDGTHHDGHDYVEQLLRSGVKNFIVEKPVKLEDANVLQVEDSLKALQSLVAHHRRKFHIPVIGITGSNAKTIVKEWLYTCLSPKYKIVRSPKSYNSRIGVPLSVWHMAESDELGIFEAGISKRSEMADLERIIAPTIGIFTNIGAAHNEGFKSMAEKIAEKSLLFRNSETVIYCADHHLDFGNKGFGWGKSEDAIVKIESEKSEDHETIIELRHRSAQYTLTLPFVDNASIENAMHCVATLLYLNCSERYIQKALSKLQRLPMRLALKPAINNGYVIDDTYSNDLGGLQQALNFFSLQNQRANRAVVLTDVLQSGLPDNELYSIISEKLKAASVSVLIGIGKHIRALAKSFDGKSLFFVDTDTFLNNFPAEDLANSLILVKGARKFALERVVARLEAKVHGTILEIDLDALTRNLNFYRSKIRPGTKMMVMVKAFGYGSGSQEIANLLQFHRIDYLGVAYADEGVHLRKNGIHLPIMVMNPNESTFESIIQFDLQPEIYSPSQLRKFIQYLDGRAANIHIKLESGMNRLGFEHDELDRLVEMLNANDNIGVESIFSHLAGADDPKHDSFSNEQASRFETGYEKITKAIGYAPLKHLLNSPGIIRFPQFHFDMVRLGIGLYGMETANEDQDHLQVISTLKTVISQIKHVPKGHSVGYSRMGMAEHDMTIATIAIGYADGYARAFGNGTGRVMINGKSVPVFGNVCMDMTMIDVTGVDVKVGDEVEIFGRQQSIKEVAEQINTIPYEILTNVSQRVKRIYHSAG